MAVQSPSFPLGIVVITPNALDQLAPADVQRGIQRHQAGDAPAVRGQTTEVGQQKPDDGRQRTEDRGQRAEGGGRTMESADGFRILHHFSQLPADAGANTLQLFLFEPIKITIVCRASKPVHRLLQLPIGIRKLG